MANTPAPDMKKQSVVVKTEASSTVQKKTTPAAKPAAKPVVKAAAKPAVKPAAKPAAKAVAKPAAKPAAAPKTVAAAAPVAAPKAAVSAPEKPAEKSVKVKKGKLVRDSFTMPEAEYSLIAAVKKRCLARGLAVKKSEVLRAAVISFAAQSDAAIAAALLTLAVIKTGRPLKGK